MTARPLGFDFPAMTPPIARAPAAPLCLSVRPPHAIDADERLLGLVLERDRRRTAFPRMIAAGRLLPDQAARSAAILDAIIADWTEPSPDLCPRAWHDAQDAKQAARAASTWRWDDKVRELRREIALRRNACPARIAAGRMTEAEARTGIERLEGVHWRYWIHLDYWSDPPGHVAFGHPAFYDPIRTAAQAIDTWLIAAHRAADPAVAHYLSAETLHWLDHHHPREAA